MATKQRRKGMPRAMRLEAMAKEGTKDHGPFGGDNRPNRDFRGIKRRAKKTPKKKAAK